MSWIFTKVKTQILKTSKSTRRRDLFRFINMHVREIMSRLSAPGWYLQSRCGQSYKQKAERNKRQWHIVSLVRYYQRM